jgi:hypothetical protein
MFPISSIKVLDELHNVVNTQHLHVQQFIRKYLSAIAL